MTEDCFRHVVIKLRLPTCLVAALAAALAASAGPAKAQTQEGKRIYDEQLRVRLDQQDPEKDRVGFDVGGWATFGLFNFDDSVGEKHTLRQYELRLWGSLNIDGVHKFYIRGMGGYDNWNDGQNTKSYHGDEDAGPRIEQHLVRAETWPMAQWSGRRHQATGGREV